MQNNSSIRQKPTLSRRAFWDIDLPNLDFEQYPEFVIIRAMERGTIKDIREIFRYYGGDKIRITLINAETLLPRAQVVARRLFHLHNSDFRCFTAKQRATNYSMY